MLWYGTLLKIARYTAPVFIAYKLITGVQWLEDRNDFVSEKGIETIISESDMRNDVISDTIYEKFTLNDSIESRIADGYNNR